VSSEYAPSRRASKIADWLEVVALTRGRPLAAAQLQDLGATHGYSPADVSVGVNAAARRRALLGDAYPFRTAGGGISATTDAPISPWSAMLLMSAESPVRPALDIAIAAEHLERITRVALSELYGPNTEAIRFGWPSESGRPAEFPDAIRWLAEKMNVSPGTSYRPPHRKDGGVDVVAWRPFPDGRSGFPVLLVQCTLERNYTHKATDIDLRVWSGWLRLDTDPATALAIPEVVPAGEEWNSLAARTVVLDRPRLTGLAAPILHSKGLEPVRDWLESTLDSMHEA
jgi:hypothetical protein